MISEEEVQRAKALISQYETEQHEAKTLKMIRCASCGKEHQIGQLAAIVTHWYVRPSGCTDGDYWVEGEWHFICPITETRNRLLFQHKRNEDTFKRLYRKVFGSLRYTYEEDDRYKLSTRVINYFAEGLVNEHQPTLDR